VIYLRQRHQYGFRSGEWAHLFSIQHNAEGKDMWVVEFPDGAMDVWPSWDVVAEYDVKVQIEPPEGTDDGTPLPTSLRSARDSARAILNQ
jgi:hypothetical protein